AVVTKYSQFPIGNVSGSFGAGVKSWFKKLYFLCAVAAAMFVSGCGTDPTKVDFSEKLTIAMNAVFQAPADATGNAEPKNLIITLNGLTVTSLEGETVDLFEDSDPIE